MDAVKCMEPAFCNDQQGVTQCPNESLASVVSPPLYRVKFRFKIMVQFWIKEIMKQGMV